MLAGKTKSLCFSKGKERRKWACFGGRETKNLLKINLYFVLTAF